MVEKKLSFFGKLKVFVQAVFRLDVHILFAVIWYLALDGTLASVFGVDWQLDLGILRGIATLFFVLFYLRVVDEIKDYTYDQVYNPKRPLVLGIVRKKDLAIFMLLTALVVILLNLSVPVYLLILLLIDLGYGLFLLWLEKVWPALSQEMILNLFFTYPVNILMSVYIYLSFLDRYSLGHQRRGSLLILAFALAFLHYEFGRKVSWEESPPQNKRLYSNVLGRGGAISLLLIFGVGALALVMGLVNPWSYTGISAIFSWVPLVGLYPIARGIKLYLHRIKGVTIQERPGKWAILFLIIFYFSLILQSFVITIST